MLRQLHTDGETPAEMSYRPVPRRDEMTDAHIEDFLDHRCAPLVGTVSYEERQQLRAELLQEIVSIVAAHEELGSTRQQAIALALSSLAAPSIGTVAKQVSKVQQVEAIPAATSSSVRPALWTFGTAAASSLLLIFANRHSSGDSILVVMSLLLGMFPFVAGSLLGLKRTSRPIREMAVAQLLLYVPITTIFWLLVGSEVHRTQLIFELMPFTAAYTAISTLFGGVGILAGNGLRRMISRRRK